MALALLEEEQEVVDAVLWFANLKRITSTTQIEKRFSQLNLVPGVFQIIKTHEVEAYRNDQEELRDWLAGIAHSHGVRVKLEPTLAKRLGDTVNTTVTFEGGCLTYKFGLTGVQACCAFGVALLLDKQRGVTTRLKQCRYSQCRRFNLDLVPKGRPRTFCDKECKRKFDNETAKIRVNRYRKKSSHPNRQ